MTAKANTDPAPKAITTPAEVSTPPAPPSVSVAVPGTVGLRELTQEESDRVLYGDGPVPPGGPCPQCGGRHPLGPGGPMCPGKLMARPPAGG